MGRLLDYYRQFRELSPAEISREMHERREEERRRMPVEVGPLDLSVATWHEPPHPDAVNAATFALRGSIQTYPDPTAARLRAALAAAHGVAPERVVVGHGAAELLRAALRLLAPSDAVLVAWPGWGPSAELIREAGATSVPFALEGAEAAPRWRSESGSWTDVPAGAGTPPGPALAGTPPAGPERGRPASTRRAAALPRLAGRRVRAVVVSRPADPTGVTVAPEELAASLPPHAWLLLDEALAGFLPDGADGLVDHPRVLHIRSFSKADAMAGFRVGYAIVPEGATGLAAELAPALGVGAVAQAGALWAIDSGGEIRRRRRDRIERERTRLAEGLAGTPVSFPPGHGPYVWLASAAHDGHRLVQHLAARRIFVAPGTAWGDDRHVRATLRDEAATVRLVAALRELP
jgi:histidinol-phosphate aminotransferase